MTPRPLLPLLALVLAGCGVAEYEGEMKKAQQRLTRFDEESKVLGTPIQPPMAKDMAGTLETKAAVFLRLPSNITPGQATDQPRGGVFYDYIPATGKTGPFTWVSLAIAKPDEKDFTDTLMKWYPPAGEVKRGPHTTRPDGRAGAAFTRTTYEDATYRYSLNVHRGNLVQLAILYAVPRAQAQVPAVARTIDLSLDTFGMDGALEPARSANRPGGPLDFVPR